MKQISNKAFTKFITLMANQPISASRLSALIDASPEEGIDVLMFGRLKEVSVTDEAKFDMVVEQELKKRYWNNCVFDKVTGLNISGVMSFDVKGLYHQGDKPEAQQKFSLGFLATDDAFEDCVEFGFKD